MCQETLYNDQWVKTKQSEAYITLIRHWIYPINISTQNIDVSDTAFVFSIIQAIGLTDVLTRNHPVQLLNTISRSSCCVLSISIVIILIISFNESINFTAKKLKTTENKVLSKTCSRALSDMIQFQIIENIYFKAIVCCLCTNKYFFHGTLY